MMLKHEISSMVFVPRPAYILQCGICVNLVLAGAANHSCINIGLLVTVFGIYNTHTELHYMFITDYYIPAQLRLTLIPVSVLFSPDSVLEILQ